MPWSTPDSADAVPCLFKNGTSLPTLGKKFCDQPSESASAGTFEYGPLRQIAPPCVSIQSRMASTAVTT
jgi:hypothetical protein